MGITNTYERRAVSELTVRRDERQRRDILTPDGAFINSDGLMDSIREHGVMSPLLCTRSGEIIFGERRFTAAKLLGHTDVPVRYVEDLSELTLRVIELEENLRRTDLTWRDQTQALASLHKAYAEQAKITGAPKPWSQADSARTLNIDTGVLSQTLRVAEDLGNARIRDATSMRQAYNTLSRLDDRLSAEVLDELSDTVVAAFAQDTTAGASDGVLGAADAPPGQSNAPTGTATNPTAILRRPVAPPDDVLTADFLTWASTYSGPRFNLLHCDFPYGINHGAQGEWSGKNSHSMYEDSEATYHALIDTLCANLDRLATPSMHLVFWLSADISIMSSTIERFRQRAPSLVFWPKPLIWHKTDNAGVAPDPRRWPRHAYEAAIVAAREDRPLVKLVSDIYGAPTDKRWHTSAKPEPTLRHFLSMFTDEFTRLLDPTCGSGTALRACESLGAESVLGLEVNDDFAELARKANRQFRALRAAS